MKRIAIFVVIFAIIGIFLGFHFTGAQTSQTIKGVQNQLNPTATLAQPQSDTPEVPKSLSIPSLNVHDITVEQVGLDAEKRMDVPSSFMNTGWYMLGPKPGEIGNAVIDGHLDTPTGAPSVFWNIKNMRPGDTIEVTDADGKTYTFSVTKVVTYGTSTFPIETVFGTAQTANLNLITCGGTWDKQKKDYSNRTVVFSTLQQ